MEKMEEKLEFNPIVLEILWTRLISLVDEAASGLVRTSFSTAVREGNDFACVLMDRHGDSVAHSSLSIPSFLGTLPITTKHFLKKFSADTIRGSNSTCCGHRWKN
jgi:N-methylhydantoinase B